MGTFSNRCYLPHNLFYHALSVFHPRCSSLTDSPRDSYISRASSVPASSGRFFRRSLPPRFVAVSPWRASRAGNLVGKMTQRRPNLARRGDVLAENREQTAISSTSTSPNEWTGRKSRTRNDVPNGKLEGSERRKHGIARINENNARNKHEDHYDPPPLRSKKRWISRDSKANRQRPEDVQKKGEAGEPRKRMDFTPVEEGKVVKNGKKAMDTSTEFELRVQLDMCSKKGDVIGAISLYDSAVKEGIGLQQYHYNVLLYLCSSAAVGVVYPGKSGSSNSGSSTGNLTDFFASAESTAEPGTGSSKNSEQLTDENGALLSETETGNIESMGVRVSEDIRNQASTKGFEIYEMMCSQGVAMNEATLTSVARIAMATGNGDLAFEIVKKIKDLGLTVRLRSYAPALYSYCNNGEVDKAFEVERHMLESGVHPEEPELAALLKVSIEAKKGDKVYYLFQKLRASVRQVSPSTAELIEKWFKSPTASKVGKRKWKDDQIAQAMANGGGGWHGLGWLGTGKWILTRDNVDENGVCLCCGEKLVAVDIDPVETENFSRAVALIAAKRDKKSSFHKFQKWLDYYGPFEAVIDAANVGLYSQRQFSVVKVNAIVNGVRQQLPSKKWPLIVVHNRRVYDGRVNKPMNYKLIEKWKNADALYATPTGSNDDWYWLYAAVKCKSLIVTNDEMRDHSFQVLGNDFFPKWKERHQVRFTFKDGSPQFYMPPACSTVIQESEKGDWHVPISSEEELGAKGTWLCIRRKRFDSPCDSSISEPIKGSVPHAGRSSTHNDCILHSRRPHHLSDESLSRDQHLEIVKTVKKVVVPMKKMKSRTVASDLDAAEGISGYVVDFQI